MLPTSSCQVLGFLSAACCCLSLLGCPADELTAAPSRVAEIITGMTPGLGWESLSVDDRAYLEDRAALTLAGYRAAWGHQGLTEKSSVLLSEPSGSAALEAFDAAVRVRYRSRLADPDTYKASTDAPESLRSLLLRLHLVHLGARRINVVRYDGLADVDWDGRGAIRAWPFPLPDAEAMSAQRAFATTIEEELLALDPSALDTDSVAIRQRALLYARQLASGATGFRFGGRDLETPWGVAQWSWDLMCNMSDACFGKVWSDDDDFLDAVNAWFFGPLRWLDKGSLVGLDFAIFASEDWSEVTRLLGNPDQHPTALAYLRLVSLWKERVGAMPDATADCTIYSAEDRTLAWRSFTAENLLYPEISGSLTDLGGDVDDFMDTLREQQKAFVVRIVEDMRDAGETDQATVDSVNAQLATIGASSLEFIINAGFTALSATDTAAADLYSARLETLKTIGGPDADEAIFQDMWDSVTQWVVNRYFGGAAANPATGEPYLPADIVLNPSGGALTTADGEVQMGIYGKRPPTTYYRLMLHEAHHSVLAREGAFPEGASWEGAALMAEMEVLPLFLEEIWAGDPTYGERIFYYLAGDWIEYQYLMAGSDATLGAWLRDTCEPDALAYVSDVAEAWSLPEEAIESLTERTYQGLNYLQYVAEGVGYREAMLALDDRLGPGRQLDPFTIIACGVGLLQDDEATAQTLASCLGLAL